MPLDPSATDQSEDPLVFSENCNNAVSGCVRVEVIKGSRYIGLAIFDTQRFTISLCEFQDDTSYTSLESVLIQGGLSQCYCCVVHPNQHSQEKDKIQRVIQRCGIFSSSQSLQDADIEHIESFKPLDVLLRQQEKTQQLATGIQSLLSGRNAAYHLVHQLALLDDLSQAGQYSLYVLSPSKFMRLDYATVLALHIFPQNKDQKPTSGNSLFGLLNKCRTPMGTTRLRVWVRQCSLDPEEIRERQHIVTLFVNRADLRHILGYEFFRRLPNLDMLANKFHRVLMKPNAAKSISSLNDVLSLHNGVKDIASILELLRTVSGSQSETNTLSRRFLDPLAKHIQRLKRFHDLVEYTFDAQERSAGRAVIHRQFNESLRVLIEKKEALLRSIEDHRRDVQDSLFLPTSKKVTDPQTVKLVECNTFAYLFRVKKKDQTVIQKEKKRFRQVRINKADFQFTTNELSALCKEVMDISHELESHQHELACKTILAAASYWPVIELLADLLGFLDVLLAFAEVACTSASKYTCPRVGVDESKPNTIYLVNGRHPLLEVQHTIRNAENMRSAKMSNIVPNSIDLKKPESHVHLISGPNMGGKSTYIRQVALICLMCQLGCYVPCDMASVPILDAILCRVGASDDQQKGISTFYAEMIETAAILKAASPRSLILMDELGRGTSTSEGLALALEVTRYIATTIQCYCIFATHFQELSALEATVPGVKCFQVDVRLASNQLQFLFRIVEGSADHSYGIHVAQLAQMNSTIIKRAQEVSQTLHICDERRAQLPYLSQTLYASIHDIIQSKQSAGLPSIQLDSLVRTTEDILRQLNS